MHGTQLPVATLGTTSGTPTFTSSLSVTTTASTPSGTYTVTINGSADDVSTRSTAFTLTVNPAFVYTLSVNPTSASVIQSKGTTATVTATLTQGTSRSITLSTAVTGPACTAPNCPVATLGTATGTPTFTSSLSITTTTSTPAGTYTVTISGTTDDVSTRSTTFSLIVGMAFTYSLAVSPNSASVIPTGSTSATVTATLQTGTSRSITLSTTVTGPACTAPNCPVATLGTATGTPSFTSTLSITTTAANPTGVYTITINGSTDDVSTRLTTFTLTVTPAFVYSLSVSPNTATIVQSKTASATVSATLSQGTSRSITLSTTVTGPACTAPNCPVATLGTATGTPSFTSTLSITTTASTPTGSYTITISGSTDDLSTRSTTFTLTVNAAFVYSLGVSPSSASVIQKKSTTATVTATLVQGTSRSITLSTTVTGPACTAPNCPVASFNTASSNPTFTSTMTVTTTTTTPAGRSAEPREGKECRSRWTPYQ